jgi:Sulfatase-modifying factor enzyme 1
MSARWRGIAISAVLALLANAAGAQTGNPLCPADSVSLASACLDKFEASVWRVPAPTTLNVGLVKKIRLGTATRADLTAAGATQLGVTPPPNTVSDPDYAPCTINGQNCANDIYAVSLPSVTPSAFITWFQAQEACANAGKRLPTNAEWQVGANGTPDPGPDNGTTDCNSAGDQLTPTGSRSRCVSARGAFDMAGNVAEWVAEWVPRPRTCPGWAGSSNDAMCLAGADDTQPIPAAIVRGGTFLDFVGAGGGLLAGPLAIEPFPLSNSEVLIGFRCAR